MDQYFQFGTELKNLLFENWNTSTWRDFIVTFLFFAFLAICLEAIGRLELLLGQYYYSNPLTWSWKDDHTRTSSSLLEPLRIPSSISKIKKKRFKLHILRCTIHVMRLVIGYLLMLAVMTYNAHLLIAIVGGSTVGYFIFGQFQSLKRPRRQSHWQSSPSENVREEPDKLL